jgi:hypothetical protein
MTSEPIVVDPIYPGSVVRVTNAPGFKNAAGVLTDPTLVKLRWRRHGESETEWLVTAGQVIKDSVGLYHADITVAEPGLHYFRWEGTGAVVAAAEGTFSAQSSFVVGTP